MPFSPTIDETNLKLTGNKIELASRPKENQSTASSRCALLGRNISRPVSAVPLLNLNYNEFDVQVNTRRPLSADYPLQLKKSHRVKLSSSRYDSIYTDGTTSVESGEETEGALPSSQLLQTLLSEPLHSWRNGVRYKNSKTKALKKSSPKINTIKLDNNDSNETPSAGSDTSSSVECVSTKQEKPETPTLKPQAVQDIDIIDLKVKPRQEEEPKEQIKQVEEFKVLNEPDRNICTMTLLPGLKTKPPLPKKPDHLNSAKNIKNTKSNLVSNEDLTLRNNKSNFEKITVGMINCSRFPSTNLENLEEEHKIIDKVPVESIEESKAYNLQNLEENNQISTSTSDSDEATELKIQNWFQEQKVNEAIMESELKTDISLHNLKRQNVEKSAVAEKVDERENKHKSTLSSNNKHNLAKTVNFEDFVCENLKSYYEKSKKNLPEKDFIKHNIKLTSKMSSKRNTLEATDVPKKQFTATQMKSFADYKEIDINQEVESWMSAIPDKPRGKGENSSAKAASYLDFLNKIDDIQKTCGDPVEDLSEPEKDTTEHNDAGGTYDDIVSILQALEEQDKKSQSKMETLKEIVNTELSASESENYTKIGTHTPKPKHHNGEITENGNKISSVNFKEHHVEREIPAYSSGSESDRSSRKTRDLEQSSGISSSSSSTNLNDIFSFLDEVDRNCSKSLATAKDRIKYTAQIMDANIKLDTIPKLEDLLTYTNVDLSNHIVDLSLRLKEKSSSIGLLQKELSTLREQITKMTKDSGEIIKLRLRAQKEDYENVVKRHQKFIDQLIADKKTLNQQCEGLIHEMKVLEDRFNSNLKAADHRHKVELQKVKEMHVAGEKIRRDRWIDTKTQKIKELTVKGLEPELEKMAARHQQDLSDLRALHKREIEDLELRSARKMQQQCEALREQLVAERERAVTHERDVLRQRYEQLVESEEQNYQEQRRRLLVEHAKRVSECEERENTAATEKDRAIKQAHGEFEDKLQATIRRHNSELNVLKEKTELEMEAFRNNYKKQMGLQLTEKEGQIREKYRKERDKEIEAVIERLEMESSETKEQIEQSAENRMRRLKEKYEKEIKDFEQSEKETTNKYSDTKSKLLETEDQIITLKASIKQLELQLHESKELSEKLSTERSKLKEVIKEEMKQEVHALEKEVHELKNDKDKELQQVYARVKLAVARKDEALSELNRDHIALQEKCTYLENMLEQQRKEYLIK